MARRASSKSRTKNDPISRQIGDATVGYEAKLWRMADAVRGSMDAAECKLFLLGLIFLKHISDAFEEPHTRLVAGTAQRRLTTLNGSQSSSGTPNGSCRR